MAAAGGEPPRRPVYNAAFGHEYDDADINDPYASFNNPHVKRYKAKRRTRPKAETKERVFYPGDPKYMDMHTREEFRSRGVTKLDRNTGTFYEKRYRRPQGEEERDFPPIIRTKALAPAFKTFGDVTVPINYHPAHFKARQFRPVSDELLIKEPGDDADYRPSSSSSSACSAPQPPALPPPTRAPRVTAPKKRRHKISLGVKKKSGMRGFKKTPRRL